MKNKTIKFLIGVSALMALTVPFLAQAQVSSNFWKYISGILQPNVVGIKGVNLNATTTVGDANSDIILGKLNLFGQDYPLINCHSLGSPLCLINNALYVFEDPSQNTDPSINLISHDTNSIASLTQSTSTNSVTLGSGNINLNATNLLTFSSGATTTGNHGIDISDGCFAVNGACISGGTGTGLFTYTAPFIVAASTSPIASIDWPFYSLSDTFPGLFMGSRSGNPHASLTLNVVTNQVGLSGGNQFNIDSPVNLSSTTATSTGANGFNLTAGCWSVLNACVGNDGSFSTTSANYWKSVNNFYSTSSADYWKTQNNFFATTSADYWKTANNFFSTTSADYWDSTKSRWATTSSDYWLTTKSTSNLTEGSNLYYTLARFAAALAGTTTDALAEGLTNLYWTPARFDTRFATKSTSDLTEGSRLYYTDARVNSYIHASSTIPKTYSNNTFTGNNTFNGLFTLGTLNGPLQANNGAVSATTSIGVLYGGLGLTTAPSYGVIPVGNNLGGYTLTATSSLGIGGTTQWDNVTGGINYAGGKVGVGTTTPYGTLAVQTVFGTPGVFIASTTGDCILCINPLNGNIGIGEKNANRQLIVRTDANAVRTIFGLYNGDTTDNNGVAFRFAGDTTGVGAASSTEFGGIRGLFTDHNAPTKTGLVGVYDYINAQLVFPQYWNGYNSGIGTQNPNALLHLASTTDNTMTNLLIQDNGINTGNRPLVTIGFQAQTTNSLTSADSSRIASGFYSDGSGYGRAGLSLQLPSAAATWFDALTLLGKTTNVGTSLMGVGSTSPWATLAVNPTAADPNEFVVGSSTKTDFIINNAGLVGIGTTSPRTALDVTGSSTVRNGSTNLTFGVNPLSGVNRSAIIPFDTTTADTDVLMIGGSLVYLSNAGLDHSKEGEHTFSLNFYDEKGGSTASILMSTSTVYAPTPQLSFNPGSGNTVNFNVSGGGNVGIASSSPFSTLSVGGDAWLDNPSSGTTRLRMESSEVLRNDGVSQYMGNVSGATLPLILRAGGSDRLYINNTTGNVGIGTTSPQRTLVIEKAGVRGEMLLIDQAAGFVDSITQGGTYLATQAGIFSIAGQNSQGSGQAADLVVDQVNHRVGAASTTPWKTLSVGGTMSVTGLTTNTGAAAASLCLSSANEVTKNTDNETCLSSSRRDKTEIFPLANGLDEVMKLTPYTFLYKKPEENSPLHKKGKFLGFMAEDTEAIDSRLVSYNDDGLVNGIRWSHITTLLVKSVQEQQGQIDNLENQIKNNAKIITASAQDKPQWYAIAFLLLLLCLQQYQIYKLKK